MLPDPPPFSLWQVRVRRQLYQLTLCTMGLPTHITNCDDIHCSGLLLQCCPARPNVLQVQYECSLRTMMMMSACVIM
jgi:hypothetical protein